MGARDVEAQAGALARSLGREERIEDPSLVLLRDSVPVVEDADEHTVAFRLDRDGYLTSDIDGVERVVEKVHPHLLQLATNGNHPW
jgi:hypothetical protein